ncbi:MAG: hypothetical protein QXP45_02125 [Thermoproteota archaeon]
MHGSWWHFPQPQNASNDFNKTTGDTISYGHPSFKAPNIEGTYYIEIIQGAESYAIDIVHGNYAEWFNRPINSIWQLTPEELEGLTPSKRGDKTFVLAIKVQVIDIEIVQLSLLSSLIGMFLQESCIGYQNFKHLILKGN